MKLVILLSFLISIGFSETKKEVCIKDLKSLYQLKVKLQEDQYQYQRSHYNHNIYAAELYLEFRKKDFKKINKITTKSLVNCKGIISENELKTLEKSKFYDGELLKQ